MISRLPRLRIPALALALFAPMALDGQLISLKTVPVAAGDQFLTLPSTRLAMAGVAIALDDALSDPFVNPAKGALIERSLLVSAPTYYGISDHNGSGRTLPMTAYFRSDRGFGAISAALQQITNGDEAPLFAPEIDWAPPLIRNTLDESSATNLYLNGVLGRELGDGLSLGGSVAVAKLGTVDGVEHLYALSHHIDQSGHALDIRAGLFIDRGGKEFEAVVLHNRFNMTHEVSYSDWVVFPTQTRPSITNWVQTNEDRTRTWGLHLGFVQTLTESGWRVGGIATANRKSHPKIPNYEIQNIPRDPGTSWAYDFGVGIAKESGPATFGVDLVFEPIWSDTWAEAQNEVVPPAGPRIPVGGKTVENDFFFTNVHVRMGVAYETAQAGVQLGVEGHSFDYTLEQIDHILQTFRKQGESWMEWTPTLGARLKFPEIEVAYSGRLTTGTGRPGVLFGGPRVDEAFASDIVLAPRGPLTLQDATVITHRVSVSIPIR